MRKNRVDNILSLKYRYRFIPISKYQDATLADLSLIIIDEYI